MSCVEFSFYDDTIHSLLINLPLVYLFVKLGLCWLKSVVFFRNSGFPQTISVLTASWLQFERHSSTFLTDFWTKLLLSLSRLNESEILILIWVLCIFAQAVTGIISFAKRIFICSAIFVVIRHYSYDRTWNNAYQLFKEYAVAIKKKKRIISSKLVQKC